MGQGEEVAPTSLVSYCESGSHHFHWRAKRRIIFIQRGPATSVQGKSHLLYISIRKLVTEQSRNG